MERMLQKMARQLNAYDEASLIALWDKYATIVERFEPTKRWEEAAIVFSLIQAVRLKNQLFNQHLAAGLESAHTNANIGAPLPGMDKTREWFERNMRKPEEGPGGKPENGKSAAGVNNGKVEKRCKILSFKRSKGNKPV